MRGRVLVAASLVGLGTLAVGAAMEGTLVYAQAPGQVVSQGRAGERVRVEGTVVPGSLVASGGRTGFLLEGGGKRLAVTAVSAPPGAFREGQGAVVEGTVQPAGGLVADRVIAQHGNTYRAAP